MRALEDKEIIIYVDDDEVTMYSRRTGEEMNYQVPTLGAEVFFHGRVDFKGNSPVSGNPIFEITKGEDWLWVDYSYQSDEDDLKIIEAEELDLISVKGIKKGIISNQAGNVFRFGEKLEVFTECEAIAKGIIKPII